MMCIINDPKTTIQPQPPSGGAGVSTSSTKSQLPFEFFLFLRAGACTILVFSMCNLKSKSVSGMYVRVCATVGEFNKALALSVANRGPLVKAQEKRLLNQPVVYGPR